tara:strand:+ start:33 stop:989 length:957 start_codon:yes stop_codon:yes gene_type:complete
MAQEALGTGGKRIRARLALLACGVLGVSKQDAVCWAAAVELVHNATLVHDDIQDGDTHRRGRETVWVKHGVGQAINVGDLMLVLPYQALDQMDAPAELRWYLSRALAYRSGETVRGQAEDMSLVTDRLFDWESYVRVAEGKSGQLLALPVEGAAILAGIKPQVAREIGNVYATLGTLYQMQDDVLDLYGIKGRVSGTDLREGKMTALVSAHLERYPEETEELVALLEAPSEEISEELVSVYRKLFREGGALDDVLASIDSLREAIVLAPVLLEHPLLLEGASELADWIVRELDEHLSSENNKHLFNTNNKLKRRSESV